MIKDYKKFLEEIKITRELTPDEAFNQFIECLENCQDYFKREKGQFSHSYSSSAQIDSLDPEEDFELVNEYMTKCGFSLDVVKSLSKEYGEEKFNTNILNINPSSCAPIDYYLYKITNEFFPLQGFDWGFFEDKIDYDIENNEILIKFGYGWHTTKYGKLCIEQNLGTIDHFMIDVIKQFPVFVYDYLFRDDLTSTSSPSGYLNIRRRREPEFEKSFSEFFLLMDNTFYIHLDEFCEFIQNSLEDYYVADEINFDEEQFYNVLIKVTKKMSDNFIFDIQRRDDDVRISIKTK